MRRLLSWLKANAVTYEQFGERIERDHSAVARYVAGKSIPSPTTMVRIYVETRGEVQPNDFYDLPDLAGVIPPDDVPPSGDLVAA